MSNQACRRISEIGRNSGTWKIELKKQTQINKLNKSSCKLAMSVQMLLKWTPLGQD